MGERLRVFVRERVKKDGAHYIWGNASRLAEFLKVDNGWVTEYTDQPPTSHADIDTALEICRFYHVTIADFQSNVAPAPSHAPDQKTCTRRGRRGTLTAVVPQV